MNTNLLSHTAHVVFARNDDGTVSAAIDGNPRRLTFDPATGNVVLNGAPHPIGVRMSRHAFEVQAREYLHDAAPAPRPCCGEGAGWLHHYGWTGDGRFADQPERCPACNPGDGATWGNA